jgi:S-adenosylmethionine:tRNA ribosyltransferase-isomerase
VLNDTRVIPSRLYGRRYRGETSARIEIMLHKREGADRWLAFARPAKKLSLGETIVFGDDGEGNACELGRLQAEVVAKGEGGEVELRFALPGLISTRRLRGLANCRCRPISPASVRPTGRTSDYQTMHAREDGAVAAPTAGLHFTPELVAALEARGVSAISSRCMSEPAPSCRSRRKTPTSIACMPNGAASRADGRRAECGQGQGRAHCRRRHDLAAIARKRDR